ncbi:myomegalin isoform X1 [Drosophila biarmipes]|uniref:myomegalin isoform X1 n=1 Tax=Drosophila biarmipes TaxID=125945 RepID=UPI0007E66914|nr:myomegalin isoform X1 [Drosophila biarmipes]XP_043948248.1 myomegalin isoform X1 [Drosophila biarmipes]XP_050744506.1 myomegalin isoform X1 [Drosophila biarmipes]
MFNLLRRSRRGKAHKIVDEEEEEADRPVRYSKIGEPSLREERPGRARRAVIEELEDFASDFDDDASRKGNGDGNGDEERLKLAKTAANGRSDNLYINKMGGDARTWSFSSGGDRNAAPSSQNEAASEIASRSHSGQLIGTIESEIDGPATPITHRQTRNDIEPQKRQSLLSIGSFKLTNSKDSPVSTDTSEQTKKRKTLQKSRDFLSDIFMARGRNHQRQHPNQNQKQQKIPAAGKANKSNKSNAKDVIAAAIATHLETNSDPALASPTTYQMTLANNSVENSGQRRALEEKSKPAGGQEESSPSFPAENVGFPEKIEPEKEEPPAMRSSAFLIRAASVERPTAIAEQQHQHGNATAAPQQHQAPQQPHQVPSSDITMGQTSAKPSEISSAHSSRASTPREFRESVVSAPQAPPRHQKSPEVPKITVEDCSFPDESLNKSQEIFYELNEPAEDSLNIEELNEAHIETLEDEVFATDIPSTVYQNSNGRPWTRLSNVKLENVQEEEEQEEEEEDQDEVDEAVDLDYEPHMNSNQANGNSRQSASSERSALKSDSNLSSSYADSGIGDQESPAPPQHPPQPPPRSSSHMATTQQHGNHTFIRDGNSTDCEEAFLQCDELGDIEHFSEFSERLVCIESISLPDVVVESTTANATASGTTPAATTASPSLATTNGGDSQININIANGAGGNSMGNVHFIPIHVEGRSRSNSPKQRSRDDSCLGQDMTPCIEIIEDGSVLNKPVRQESPFDSQELRKELKQQKARFASQLDEAHKNASQLEAKVGEMQFKIQKLEQELSVKQWNVERLQSELSAAHKDDEYVRKKLKLLEDEKVHLRHKYSENQDEFQIKYDELEAQYTELTEKYKETQGLAKSLQTQLACAQVEAEEWRQQVEKIRAELEEQIRILKNALENSEAERKICEDKWQKEFEMLRTHNREREESLMTDCEWQLRQMQRQCKDKTDKCNYERKQASAKAEELELELQSRRRESEMLRTCQAQVSSLRGVVSEQEQSIQTLMDRIENLKADLQSANENLETQIEAVHKIKYQCDNAIYDKERQMIYKIDEVRNEAAAFWENKLYTEMTRLTNELESVYVDERREALDKLQNEHIEELRALTNRYTANEEELRAEIEDLHESLELKKQDFLSLRERSDNALLQTRMHLDKADREYQNAMCREEDRRVELEEKLKKEFEAEKAEMEDKFRERLGQVKEEFAKELQLSTQDMVESHRKELDSQKAKLQAEKDEALQELVERHRAKMAAADERINDVELRHQRNLKDLKAAYDAEKAALDKRDISNANEIEQLHRKCRCLTNLFEEMRMRYERRDPRAEDLREISELRTRCESQERDLYVLTDRLREMQIQMSEMQQNGDRKGGGKSVKKPPPKSIATSCDVIYEENEERESPEQENGENSSQGDDDEEEEEEIDQEPSDTESNHTIEVNGKSDRINEDDAHLITAV